MKICTCCKISQSETNFHKRTISPDGLSLVCKPCGRVKSNAHYNRSKEQTKKQATAWALANPERRKEIAAKSAEKHREKKRIQSREHQREKRRLNPEAERAKGRRYTSIRRAREVGNGGTIDHDSWQAIINVFEFQTCLYCGENGVEFVMDHFMPVKHGGRTEAGNLLPCCFTCNAKKNAKLPQEWLSEASYASIAQFLQITKEALAEFEAGQ